MKSWFLALGVLLVERSLPHFIHYVIT